MTPPTKSSENTVLVIWADAGEGQASSTRTAAAASKRREAAGRFRNAAARLCIVRRTVLRSGKWLFFMCSPVWFPFEPNPFANSERGLRNKASRKRREKNWNSRHVREARPVWQSEFQ